MVRRARRRSEPAPEPVRGCEHLSAVADVAEPTPQAEVCQECSADGKDTWAHLRMCLDCGHVGCCDSSPGRHATAHHHATGHPVMRSVEPGESWRWCYVDLELLG
ncbi:MAG: UBP-type zinc finger domain-containing protein [Mycobacterium sp.]|nr:UBP-type zinc finger domain-containing protein [Mycobacterium sp.]